MDAATDAYIWQLAVKIFRTKTNYLCTIFAKMINILIAGGI